MRVLNARTGSMKQKKGRKLARAVKEPKGINAWLANRTTLESIRARNRMS